MPDKITKEITLNAPIQRVWRALTDHEEFGAWFRVRLDGPFRIGEETTGEVTYEGHEGMPWRTRTVEMREPELFAFTWPAGDLDPNADPNRDRSGEPQLRVEFRLKAVEGGTHLTVTESGFKKLAEPLRSNAMRDNDGGWDMQMLNIRAHVGG